MQLCQNQKLNQLVYFTGFSNAMKLNMYYLIIPKKLYDILKGYNEQWQQNLDTVVRSTALKGFRKRRRYNERKRRPISISKCLAEGRHLGTQLFLRIHSLGCWNKGIMFFKFTSLNIKGSGNCNGFVYWLEVFYFFHQPGSEAEAVAVEK